MNRIILLICAALVGAFLLVAGFALYSKHPEAALLTQAPDHGTAFILEVDYSKTGAGTNELSILQEAIRRRAARVGVKIFWEPISNSQVRVVAALQKPGDAQQVQRLLFRQGVLTLRLVHEESDRLIRSGDVPPGYEILKREILSPPRPMYLEQVIVKIEAESGLSGNLIKHAMVVRGHFGEPQINFTMQPEAAAAFAKVTADNIGRRLAIVLDGKPYSAPVINSPITTGQGQITGQFTSSEALELAGAFETPLPVAVRVVESNTF
jgi:preprotein translocase subunit SecD